MLGQPRLAVVGQQPQHSVAGSTTSPPASSSPSTGPTAHESPMRFELLTDELNATPALLPGDRRPLGYHLRPATVDLSGCSNQGTPYLRGLASIGAVPMRDAEPYPAYQ
jgi:hypothetical protein